MNTRADAIGRSPLFRGLAQSPNATLISGVAAFIPGIRWGMELPHFDTWIVRVAVALAAAM